jgi:peptidoglycan/xylan/chitin deacetylase (PgdA/CDA1 family)
VVLRYQVVYRTEREFAALDPAARRVALPLETFARQLDALAFANLAVIDPGKLAADTPPRPGIVLTFDGGHASLYSYVLPLLIQRGLTAAFFFVRDRISVTGGFDWSHLRDLVAQRMTIGAAGCTGQPFSRLHPAQAAQEFRAAREALEDATGRAVVQFAFPRGRYWRHQVGIGLEAGYQVFHGTRIGAHRPDQIRRGRVLDRITIDVDTDPDAFAAFAVAEPLQLLRGRVTAVQRRVVRLARRALQPLLPAPLKSRAAR